MVRRPAPGEVGTQRWATGSPSGIPNIRSTSMRAIATCITAGLRRTSARTFRLAPPCWIMAAARRCTPTSSPRPPGRFSCARPRPWCAPRWPAASAGIRKSRCARRRRSRPCRPDPSMSWCCIRSRSTSPRRSSTICSSCSTGCCAQTVSSSSATSSRRTSRPWATRRRSFTLPPEMAFSAPPWSGSGARSCPTTGACARTLVSPATARRW